MLKYKERFDELKMDVINKFNDIVEEKGTIDFAKAILINNGEDGEDGEDSTYERLIEIGCENDLPMIEMRYRVTGAVCDVYPVSITKDGIVCVNVNEDDITYVIRFEDVASLESQILLLTEMVNC
jgi:hypothetical protein